MPLKVCSCGFERDKMRLGSKSNHQNALNIFRVPGNAQAAFAWLTTLAGTGKLGEVGRTARVIYAQTDSIFMHVPDATAVQAIDVGKQLAKLVSAAFPKPMELKFENVSWPFMLLHVNRCSTLAAIVVCQRDELRIDGPLRVTGFLILSTSCLLCRYAGRAFESSEDVAAGRGQLVVKGLKSMWRQTAPIVRMTLGELQLPSCCLSSSQTALVR